MSTAIMEISHDDLVVAEDNNTEESQEGQEVSQQLKGKKLSWKKLRRYDSLDIESSSVRGHRHGHGDSKVTFLFLFFLFLSFNISFFE